MHVALLRKRERITEALQHRVGDERKFAQLGSAPRANGKLSTMATEENHEGRR